MTQAVEPRNNELATPTQLKQEIIANLVLNGDISKLKPDEKVQYYISFCERVGVDPATQPFKLLRLNGREILYCGREGAAQLNHLHEVSHEIIAREIVSGCYVVTAKASTKDRCETSIGAVPIENLKGDALCNAMMKAETKAKRRSTLDLLGLGMLDESETPEEARETKPLLPLKAAVDACNAQPTSEPNAPAAATPAATVAATKPAAAPAPAAPVKPAVSNWSNPKDTSKVSAEGAAALGELIPADKQTAALKWLEGKGWIPPMGSLLNLSPKRAILIYNKPEEFLEKIAAVPSSPTKATTE